ncbi:Transient receptor potential channel pyrexia [Pseudolycoriella hygida]|uniref:Transient receptor potential channel pyrexia n=1 Tax=Pseudolycoriella hygida TaxID=35572 RepID=A0A9Q0RYV2_9DIPT|nr:Transient receptor potential channel pyrexia [Pseudolycoriella hygida]
MGEKENNLQWDKSDALINLDDEDDDERRSISSESSGEGLGVESPRFHKQYRLHDQEIWQNRGIDKTLKELPNFEQILDMVNKSEISVLSPGSEDANTALMIAILMERNEIVAKVLNDLYADANTVDCLGRTALHLACSLGNYGVTKILLDHGAHVNQWDKMKKVTPLHCAASSGSVECIQQLLKRGAHVNAGIEKRSALHLAIERNAVNCVETLLKYGANPNTPQVYTETPLHTAAGLGHKECMQLLLDHGADVRSQFGKRRLTALHLAAEDDYIDCVRLLLEHGAKVDARNVDNQTPLHLACLSQCVETVELLIKYRADVNAIYKDGRSALHAAIVKESKCFECAKLLLKAGVYVNKPDAYGYTPLHIAALNEFSSCAYMLIEYGADMTCRTNGGISALSFIIRRTPEVIPKFLNKFDSSITVNEHEIGDVDCEIKLDFRLLVPNTERGETELLLSFIEVGQKRVLKHPLCETFLFLKWRRIRKFFLFSLLYHAIYVMLFTLYILGVYDKNCNSTMNVGLTQCLASSYVAPVGYAVIFMNLTLLAKEFFQMAHGFFSYVRYWENWVQWAIILGVFLCATPSTMTSSDITTVPVWQHHVAAIVIFLVWLELMMTLLKTVTMMAGELEFEDIFYNGPPIQYPVTAHAMFFAFVLLVTVILTNLLVGLAVSDIQGLQASAGLDRLTRQAELVARLEGLFFSKLLRKAPSSIILLCQRSALLRTSRYHLQFCIRPNDPRDKRLPKDIVVSIYKLVAERRDRNQSIRRKRREQNFSFFTRSFDESIKGVKLRNHSSHITGPRTLSENPQFFNQQISSTKYGELEKKMESFQIQLMEMSGKLKELQTTFSNKMEDISNDVSIIKIKSLKEK